jgi:hypothetical protein
MRAPWTISAVTSITDPPYSLCCCNVRLTTPGPVKAFSLSASSSTYIISRCGWLREEKDCWEGWDSMASDRSSSLAARERNVASMLSCLKYQSEPGSGGSSASGSVGARDDGSPIGATMVAPGVEKWDEVGSAVRLVDGAEGPGRGVRRASGRGWPSCLLTVGGGGGG